MISRSKYPTSRQLIMAREAREEAKSLLPPSPGPTQVGTTRSLTFRAVVESNSEVEMEVAL
jgi:hypothetical protein